MTKINSLEKQLQKLDPNLHSKFEESKKEVNLMLSKYSSNFPTYTDHSIDHTMEVFLIASEVLSNEEIENLNGDEIYILSMGCLLHDIGMCIPKEKIEEIYQSEDFSTIKESYPNISIEELIRDIHHQLSNKFILKEWELLKIPSLKYAKAIGLIAEGHRKVDLSDFDIYDPKYFPKNGKEFSCLPYLACVLRIADELDVTNSRTPKILTKYYMPNNEKSIREWHKHIATSQRNYLDDKVIFEVDCSDQNIYAALQEQFDKIQNVINSCQKIMRSIPFSKGKLYKLELSFVDVKYNFKEFDPKGIRFSFDVQNVVTAFIGEDLYKDKLTSLREAIQNSVDSCRYKSKILGNKYTPYIKVFVGDKFISIEDNGTGMDEFIIENYFGRLASSFYEQEKIKSQFEAIGQFGVGVFSYFLLSEYIDIETKSSSNKALKFRFDKDPKSYFHFYDKTERKIEGTTIVMHLKEELRNEITFLKVEDYIRKIFKHVEIPIEINGIGNYSIIESLPFEINELKCISDRLQLQHKKVKENLTVLQVEINDNEVEGNCALIINKDLKKTFSIKYRYFEYEAFNTISNHLTNSIISVSQKGVFVNNYPASLLNLFIGDINLKKKVKINIDRNEFSDINHVLKIIRKFELKLLTELFQKIRETCIDESDLLALSNKFLSRATNYFDEDYGYVDEFKALYKRSLFVRIFDNGEYSITNLESLCDNHLEFMLISDKEDPELIYSYFHKPIVIAQGYEYHGSYSILRYLFIGMLGYTTYIRYNKDEAYEFLSINETDKILKENIKKLIEIMSDSYHYIVKCDSNKIITNLWSNKSSFKKSKYTESLFFNYNHPFFHFVISNFETIKVDQNFKKIVRSVFKFIIEIKRESKEVDQETISKLNEILKPLETISKIPEFSHSDF